MIIRKNCLTLLCLLLAFSSNVFSQITFDDLKRNSDSIVVLSKNDVAFTGKVCGTCRMWDKTREFGQAEMFISSLRKIWVEGYYLNGKENGRWIYKTVNGKLRGKMNFKKGLPHGKYVIYYVNGKKFEKGKFKNGIYDGILRCWDKDGTLNVKQIIKNGKEIKHFKYSNVPLVDY